MAIPFVFNNRGSVGVGQKWPNGHLFLCSMLMPSQSNADAESVSSVVTLLVICHILTCIFLHNVYLFSQSPVFSY